MVSCYDSCKRKADQGEEQVCHTIIRRDTRRPRVTILTRVKLPAPTAFASRAGGAGLSYTAKRFNSRHLHRFTTATAGCHFSNPNSFSAPVGSMIYKPHRFSNSLQWYIGAWLAIWQKLDVIEKTW
jgi:hypothetical protein